MAGFKDWDARTAWRIDGRYFVVFASSGSNDAEPDPFARALSELAGQCPLPLYRADTGDGDNEYFVRTYNLGGQHAIIETLHAGDPQRATPLVVASESWRPTDPSTVARHWAAFIARYANERATAAAMLPAVTAEVWRAVERRTPGSQAVSDLMDTLLGMAQEIPLDGDLMVLLDLLHGRLRLPGHRFRFCAPEIDFGRGWSAVAPAIEALGRSGFVLYSLRELRRVDDALLLSSAGPQEQLRQPATVLVTVPSRATLPCRDPDRDGTLDRNWQQPTFEYRDGVLVVQQRSAYRDQNGEWVTELDEFAAYRIQGHLVHLRTATSYGAGESPTD